METTLSNRAEVSSRQNRPLLLGTLVSLRWIALAGQTGAIIFVAFYLKYPFPLLQSVLLVLGSVFFNIILVVRFGVSHRPAIALAATQLAFDSLQLAGLLWLTGGLQNPFSLLLLAPISVSATILPRRETALVGALALAIVTLLSFSHMPLPWKPGLDIDLPGFYTQGTWVALVCGILFVTIYANRVAHEARQLSDALSATELALSRQQHLSALDGLAAAAAHELGTPLSTITLAAKEMLLEAEDGPISEDIQLIVEQAARCRSILLRLRNLDNDPNSPFSETCISQLLEELGRPLRHMGKTIRVELPAQRTQEPLVMRNAGLLHGLGNLIENAVQFARKEVHIVVSWSEEHLFLSIEDDGPGFPLELLPRLGEPYLKSTLVERTDFKKNKIMGLGLGVFIARTLLQRTGATISFSNMEPDCCARVRLSWLRSSLEPPANAPPEKE